MDGLATVAAWRRGGVAAWLVGHWWGGSLTMALGVLTGQARMGLGYHAVSRIIILGCWGHDHPKCIVLLFLYPTLGPVTE